MSVPFGIQRITPYVSRAVFFYLLLLQQNLPRAATSNTVVKRILHELTFFLPSLLVTPIPRSSFSQLISDEHAEQILTFVISTYSICFVTPFRPSPLTKKSPTSTQEEVQRILVELSSPQPARKTPPPSDRLSQLRTTRTTLPSPVGPNNPSLAQ